MRDVRGFLLSREIIKNHLRIVSQFETRMEQSVLLDGEICRLFSTHLRQHASVYVNYCSYQAYQERVYRSLK